MHTQLEMHAMSLLASQEAEITAVDVAGPIDSSVHIYTSIHLD